MNSLESLSEQFFNGEFLESRIFYTILAIVIFWLGKRLALFVLLRDRDVQVQYRIRKTVTYVTYPLVFLVVGRTFAEHDDIVFAYPTQRFYHNDVEGKPLARPEAFFSKPPTDSPESGK